MARYKVKGQFEQKTGDRNNGVVVTVGSIPSVLYSLIRLHCHLNNLAEGAGLND